MKVFDLHCDTASRITEKKESLYRNSGQLDLIGGENFEKWVQTYAFFVPDEIRGDDAWAQFEQQYAYFQTQLQQTKLTFAPSLDRVSAMLSVEGGGILGGKLERIDTLAERGIQMLTITWNHQNEWASGAYAEGGLTDFGRQGIKELERNRILVDVSHLNEQSFWELAGMATKPFIATHSNAAAICPHPRNLSDEQAKTIVDSGGLIGINFYPTFVNGKDNCTFHEIFAHIEHFCLLGAHNHLCLGTDFDGAPMPKALNSVKQLEKCYCFMVKYFGETITRNIFFENANRFFKKQWMEGKNERCFITVPDKNQFR